MLQKNNNSNARDTIFLGLEIVSLLMLKTIDNSIPMEKRTYSLYDLTVLVFSRSLKHDNVVHSDRR